MGLKELDYPKEPCGNIDSQIVYFWNWRRLEYVHSAHVVRTKNSLTGPDNDTMT